MGRFINADTYASTGQGVLGYNMFAYCDNNPTNSNDPTGEFALGLVLGKAALGAAVNVLTTYIGAKVTGQSYSWKGNELKKVTMIQCGLQTLDGIEKHTHFSSLVLYNNYSIKDISALKNVADSLTELVIENCSKLKDFSVLEDLVNLEHLQLWGNNVLPNLDFLQKMTKLKTFTFTMNVENGDLTLCLNLPYASCRDRKHFNLKDAQLPKLIIVE